MKLLANPLRDPAYRGAGDPAPLAFHRSLPGYARTELREAPALAAAAGVGRVWLKLELERFGLPAFKLLGAAWAARRLLGPYAGIADGEQAGLDELRGRLAGSELELVTATDGNHGRAVARVARLAGLAATVLVPAGTARARIAAIEEEGARVEVVDGSYDEAVRRSAALADERRLVLSDTSWPGYERVPGWVIEGYATIFLELDGQLAERAAPAPDVLLVPIGVGALAAAAARHARRDADGPALAGFEPVDAACVLESAAAGRPVTVPGPHRSIMAGLNAGNPSPVAWADVAPAYDAFCAIDDAAAEDGMRRLAALGIAAGEVSGGAVGALLALARDERARAALRLREDASVLLLLTEGVTDPEGYARVVGGAAAPR